MKKFLFATFLVVFTSVIAFGSNTLKSAEIRQDKLNLRFASYINPKHIRKMTLNNPPRIVIDMQDTNLENSDIFSSLQANGVKSFRVSQKSNTKVRLVVETYSPYISHSSQPMSSRNIYSLSLPKESSYFPTISEIDQKANQKYTKKKSQKKEYIDENPQQEEMPIMLQMTTPEPEEKKSFFASLFGGFSGSSSSSLKNQYTIVVDAGHGGHDSGAIGSGRYYEKTLVLQIARKAAKYLQKKGFRVIMTRNSDAFIELKNRTKFANKHKADIFVSIHANAIANRNRFNLVQGVETYFLQTTRSEKSLRIAAIENSVVLNENDRLSNDVILNSVLSGPKIELSHKLAIDVQSSIVGNLRSEYKGVKNGGVIPAPFWVLVGAQMPSILVEVGYITNPYERSKLFSEEYQNLIGKGIAQGITKYLTIREKEIN